MKTIKIGIVGTGNISTRHLKSYAKLEGVEIVAGCDINPINLKNTCDKFGIERRYNSLTEMLANEELDAVDVCVWNCNHAKCSIEALNAGVNVICEKPMAFSTEEAIAMKEAADKSGKLLMIAFCMRFSAQDKVVRDFIDNGYIGDIYYVKSSFLRRHGNPGGWFANKSMSGGGPVIDLGVHVIDHLRFLMGNPKPVSVYASVYNKLDNRKGLKTGVAYKPHESEEEICDVEDLATILIKFDNGATMHIDTSYTINGEESYYEEVFGTKGGFYLDEDTTKLYTELNGFMVDVTPRLEGYQHDDDEYIAELHHFLNCLRGEEECYATAQDGIEIMKILEAIYKSGETGHEVIL